MSTESLTVQADRCGFFGKIPSVGDFVSRGLEAETVQRLDVWLSKLLSDIEAQSPMCLARWESLPVLRFILAEGSLSSSGYAGVLGASRDSVGRVFPLVILYKLVSKKCRQLLFDTAQTWFFDLEDIVYVCRNQATEPDRLYQIVYRTLPEVDSGSLIPQTQVCSPLSIEKEGCVFWRSTSDANVIKVEFKALPNATQLANLESEPKRGLEF